MENSQSNLPEEIFDNLIKSTYNLNIDDNSIEPIDDYDDSDSYIGATVVEPIDDYDDFHTDNSCVLDNINESCLDVVVPMFNSLSKELDTIKQNPTKRIDEIFTEYNNICDDYNDTIKKNPILAVVSNQLKIDINICKRQYQDNLIKQYSIRQAKQRLHKSNQIYKSEFNLHMSKKKKKSIYNAENMWDTDIKSKKIGIKLQYLLDTLKYIIQTEQKIVDSVIVSNPEVIITDPEVIITDPEVIITDPEVIVTDPEVIVTDPEVIVTDPEVIITDPEVIVTDLEVIITDPEVIITDPEVIITDPEVIVTDSKVTVTDPNIISAYDIFKGICDQYYDIIAKHEKLISNDMCLVILSCEVESHIKNYAEK